MKKLLCLLLLTATVTFAAAQKMVIGSRIPDLRGVQWHTTAPASGKPMLIEFYDPSNSSGARFFPKLAEIRNRYGDRITIVVIARAGSSTDDIVNAHRGSYCIGSDTDGNIYKNFNVRFLPYTIVVNSKNELHWQGNLGNLDDQTLSQVK